jgi:hypothetical protein
MALHTQSEFAALIGKTRGWLNVYVNRGGVTNPVVGEDGFLNDEFSQNRMFLDKWLAMMPTPLPTPAPKKVKVAKVTKPTPTPTPDTLPEKPGDSLAEQKLKAEIEYKRGQVEKLKLEQAKLRGNNIPIDAVSSLVSSLSNGFQQAYKSGAESLMMELANKYKIPAKGIAELKGKLFELINSSHDKGIKLSKKELRNIIADVKFKDDEQL